MSQAWMVRSAERQDIVREMSREVIHLADEDVRRDFEYDLAHTLLNFLQKDKSVTQENKSNASVYFETEVLPRVTAFARADEERDSIVCDLLKWVMESLMIEFQHKLSRKEHTDPKKIFHADSATAEI